MAVTTALCLALLAMCELCLVVRATYDLNDLELQMVADHLSQDDCRKLSEALHMHRFRLDHPVTGDSEPQVPCIDLLKHWNTHEAKDTNFLDLPLRLKEIGHAELANKLSRMVYKDESEAVRKAFLDDPFKDLIHSDSPLLEEAPSSGHTLAPPIEESNNGLHALGVVLLVFSILVMLGITLRFYLPDKMERKNNAQFLRQGNGYELLVPASQSMPGKAMYEDDSFLDGEI